MLASFSPLQPGAFTRALQGWQFIEDVGPGARRQVSPGSAAASLLSSLGFSELVRAGGLGKLV